MVFVHPSLQLRNPFFRQTMEPLLSENKTDEQQPQAPTGRIEFQTRLFDLLSLIALLFLTLNAVNSAYRSRRNPSALAFVAFAYSDLVMLFLCLKRFDKLGHDEGPAAQKKKEEEEKKEKKRLKAAVWVLATALNLAFAWRVAGLMPPMLAIVVWLMAGPVAVGGFYFLLVDGDGVENVCAAVGNKEPSPEENI